MERKRKTFDLTPFSHEKIVDIDTISALNEELKSEWLEDNRQTFEGCKELQIEGFYYGMATFVENGTPFTLLTPYRFSAQKYPKKNFGFGAYDHATNKIFMFFNGLATTDNRTTAIMVYTSLVQYCKTTLPTFEPFAIKL